VKRTSWVAIRMAFITLLITGVVYPLAVSGVVSFAFPRQAAGSLIVIHGRVVGSKLIGQPFVSDRYFHPRPSSAGAGYDAGASGASNLGPTSEALVSAVASRVREVRRDEPGSKAGRVPVDLVTASASGLDPDISPDSAYLQVPRVAAARGLAAESVRRLVARHVAGRQLGFIGEPRVNVLELNLALDALSSQ